MPTPDPVVLDDLIARLEDQLRRFNTVALSEDDGRTILAELKRRTLKATESLEVEAANLDQMAEASRVKQSKCLCLGQDRRASFWEGRAHGLRLAAVNVRALRQETSLAR